MSELDGFNNYNFSDSESSSDDDFHSDENNEGPQLLDGNNLSRVHITPFNEHDQCVHYDLPHKEAKSLFYPTEANNYLQSVLKTELLPILKKAHSEIHQLELNTRKYIQNQNQACRSVVGDPEYTASSHLFFFVEDAASRMFGEVARKLDNASRDSELSQKIHFDRWLGKVGYYFSRTKEDFLRSNKVERLKRSTAIPKAVFQEVLLCQICTDKKPEVAFTYNADDMENMVPCTCTNVNMCLDCALENYWATTRETGTSFAKCPFCKGHYRVENIIKVKQLLPPAPVIINNANNANNTNNSNNTPEKQEANETKTEKETENGRRYPKRQRKK